MKYLFNKLLIALVLFGECTSQDTVNKTKSDSEYGEKKNKKIEDEKTYTTDTDVVKKLLEAIGNRLMLIPDVTNYKWKHGLETTMSKERFDEIMKNAESQGNKLRMLPSEAGQFMMDLIEGSNVVEYSLTSDWYSGNHDIDGIAPVAKDIDISQLRDKLDKGQEKIIDILSTLSDFRKDRECLRIVGKCIIQNEIVKNRLMRIALQVAAGKLCKAAVRHDPPYSTVVPTKKMKVKNQ